MKKEIKSIVLLSSGQPTTNPRLVKEAICLFKAGYNVTVLYSFWTSWADQPDIELKKENAGINWIRVGGHPKEERSSYLLSRFLFKLFKSLIPVWSAGYFKKNAVNRTSYALFKKANSVKADLYIAHSLGALPAAIHAAKKNRAKAGIDFEDHYSGQWELNTKDYNLYKWIEDKYIPDISFCTAASPLIAEKYKEDYPFLSPVIIHNVFSKVYLQPKIAAYKKDTLKLFWFSQTVGRGRGLEELFMALAKLDNNISVTILGYCDSRVKNEFLQYAKECAIAEGQILFIDPISPDLIFSIAAQHHIGLALESEKTINREICLTNKIFTYLLSGLAIIATDTLAQKQFIDAYPEIGCYYSKGSVVDLAELILKYQNNPELLQKHRLITLKLANEVMNWEEEQKKYLVLIGQNII